MSAKAPMAQPTTQALNSAAANHPATQALTTPAVTAEEAQSSSALPRGAEPVLDLDDLAREVRSLRRQVDTLNRRLADRPPVDEALPLRKVAPLEYLEELGVESCDGTGWLRGDPQQLRGLVDFLAGHRNLRLFDVGGDT